MKDFFKGVKKHIGRLDAQQLREQYRLAIDEMDFLDTLLRTIDRGVIALNEQGKILFSNPAARSLLGMESEDALPQLGIPLGRASKHTIELTYPENRWLEVQSLPMTSGTLILLRDITAERNRTEEELRAGATRAVRDLAAGVAHEIGNPLNAISLNLQLLQRIYPEETSIGECRQQIERLDGILRGFLQALRPSSPVLVPGNLAEPLTACLATLRSQIEDHGYSVSLEVPSALPSAAFDHNQIEQVFFNLIKNAMEAMKDGASLTISVRSDDNDVIATISDTGEGMTNEQLVHLFEPYRTSKEHGTGLGLMISKRIVTDHGGTIAVESAIGKGTTFTVRIPRIERRVRRIE